MATYDELMAAARRAHEAGDADGARRLIRMADGQPRTPERTQSMGERVGHWTKRALESGTLGIIGDEANAFADSSLPAWVPGVQGGRGNVTYDEALAARRADEEIYRTENPVGAISADVAGAFVPGLGAAGTAARGATTGAKVGRGLLAGAGAGAVMGFNEGEGGTLNRAVNAGVGAGIGGAAGAAFPFAGAGAARIFEATAPGVQRAARQAQDQLGLSRGGARLVSEAVERDMPVSDRLLREAGPNALVAQSGPQTMGLLDAIINRPGAYGTRASNEVQEFAAERGREFRRALDVNMGLPEGVARTQRGVYTSTAQARREAYGEAYDSVIDYSSPAGQAIEQILTRVDEEIIRTAQRQMRRAGESSTQSIARIADDGTVTFDVMPDVRTLDYIKRALDDATDPIKGTDGPQTRTITSALARDLRNAVDEAAPAYAAAREAGRDPIVNAKAVEFGSALFSPATKMDVAEDTLEGMTPIERSFASQGARDYINEVMANARRAQTDMNMDIRQAMRPVGELTSEAGERKLTALLGEDGAEAVLAPARAAYQALSLRANVGRNSRTEPRRQVEEMLDNEVPIGMGEAIQQGRGVSGAVAVGAGNVLGDPAAGRLLRKDDVATSVGRALMQPASGTRSAVTMNALPGLLARATQQSSAVENAANRAGGILGMYTTQRNAREPGMGLLAR